MDARAAAESLKKNRIFENADLELLVRTIEREAATKGFRRGEDILSPERSQRGLAMLLTGSARVSKGKAGISTLCAGDVFGAVTLFSTSEVFATTVTAKTECEVLFMDKAAVEALMGADPAVARGLAAYLSDRIYFLTRRIESLTAGGCESKLMSYLESRRQGSEVRVESCSGLAAELDVGRASLYRALDSLEKSGAIVREGKIIRLLNANDI